MFVVLIGLVVVVVAIILFAGIKYISPKINQGELKNDNLFVKIFQSIFELISFLIPACGISALFVIPLFSTITVTLHDSPIGENSFQQIYNYIQMTGGVLGVGIGVIAGFVLALVIRNTAHLNRIESKIAEIQEKLK